MSPMLSAMGTDMVSTSDIGMSQVARNKEATDEQGCDGSVDTLPAGAAFGDRAEPVRGSGSPGDGGDVELPRLPAGTARARVPATAAQPDRTAGEGLAPTPGEELGGAGPETAAGEGGAAVARPVERGFSGPARECAGVWHAGLGQDTRPERGGAGTGAEGSARAAHQVQSAGAGTAEGEARPAFEGAAARA